jgi:hypothetical protein
MNAIDICENSNHVIRNISVYFCIVVIFTIRSRMASRI